MGKMERVLSWLGCRRRRQIRLDPGWDAGALPSFVPAPHLFDGVAAVVAVEPGLRASGGSLATVETREWEWTDGRDSRRDSSCIELLPAARADRRHMHASAHACPRSCRHAMSFNTRMSPFKLMGEECMSHHGRESRLLSSGTPPTKI